MYSEKLEKAQEELRNAKTKEFEIFLKVMSWDICFLRGEDLVDCVGFIDTGICSYKCECSRQCIVHSKCWTRSFKRTCEVEADPQGSLQLLKVNVDDAYDAIQDSLCKT